MILHQDPTEFEQTSEVGQGLFHPCVLDLVSLEQILVEERLCVSIYLWQRKVFWLQQQKRNHYVHHSLCEFDLHLTAIKHNQLEKLLLEFVRIWAELVYNLATFYVTEDNFFEVNICVFVPILKVFLIYCVDIQKVLDDIHNWAVKGAASTEAFIFFNQNRMF